MLYEYCVMMDGYPNEPHRGPWSKQECKNWIKECEDDGFRPGAFYLAIREIGPWLKYD